MARKIHEELRRAVLDAWMHGKGWRSPLTRSMHGWYGRRYEVSVFVWGNRYEVSVFVWGNRVARISPVLRADGRRMVWLYDGGVPSAMTRDVLEDVAAALGIRAGFAKRGGEIVGRYEDGGMESFVVPSGGIPLLWG